MMNSRNEIEILTTVGGTAHWEKAARFLLPDRWRSGDLLVDVECARLLHSPPQLMRIQLCTERGEVAHEHRHYLEEAGESGQTRLARFTFSVTARGAHLCLASTDGHRRLLLGTVVATFLSTSP